MVPLLRPFVGQKRHVAVAELPEALDALLVSQVSAAIECLEDVTFSSPRSTQSAHKYSCYRPG